VMIILLLNETFLLHIRMISSVSGADLLIRGTFFLSRLVQQGGSCSVFLRTYRQINSALYQAIPTNRYGILLGLRTEFQCHKAES
jgi:hypothetical protein